MWRPHSSNTKYRPNKSTVQYIELHNIHIQVRWRFNQNFFGHYLDLWPKLKKRSNRSVEWNRRWTCVSASSCTTTTSCRVPRWNVRVDKNRPVKKLTVFNSLTLISYVRPYRHATLFYVCLVNIWINKPNFRLNKSNRFVRSI